MATFRPLYFSTSHSNKQAPARPGEEHAEYQTPQDLVYVSVCSQKGKHLIASSVESIYIPLF